MGEPIDPRYIGQDIDLATVTEEQLPELKRRAALAKEEHERAMAEKRERIAAQGQATLEREMPWRSYGYRVYGYARRPSS